MRRRTAALPAGLLALSLLVAGCSDGESAASVAVEAPAEDVRVARRPSPSRSPPSRRPPSPSASPSASASPAAPAAPSYDVKAVQRKLTELDYYVGAVDGKAGPSLSSAVMAFQKVQGIGADGVVGKATLAALAAPKPARAQGEQPGQPRRGRPHQAGAVRRQGRRRLADPPGQLGQRRDVQAEERQQGARRSRRPAGTRSSGASSASARPTSARSTTRSTSTAAGPSTAPTACPPARPATAACA